MTQGLGASAASRDWFDDHAFEVRFYARGDIVDIQLDDADPTCDDGLQLPVEYCTNASVIGDCSHRRDSSC